MELVPGSIWTQGRSIAMDGKSTRHLPSVTDGSEIRSVHVEVHDYYMQ
jgi:hypothetical protein